jgi:hypothetical protein
LALQTGVPGEGVNSSCNLAMPPAPLRHRADTHASSNHQPTFASSITRLGESAAIGHSPHEVVFGGTVLFPAELPAIDCRPTADMLIWKTVNTY